MLSKPKILVVTHDAGGSEIIAAFVKKNFNKKKFEIYTAGPGAKIFRRENIPFRRAPQEEKKLSQIITKHDDASLVLLGTGWMTKIESLALAEAKKNHIKTAVYLESWSNFRERFGYPKKGWENNAPDEVWVGDRPAQKIADRFFPHTLVRLVQNEYFAEAKRLFKELKKGAPPAKCVLFLSDAVPGTEEIFEEFLAEISTRSNEYHIRIRFHPADDRTRYDPIILRYIGKIKIEKSKEKNLAHDLLYARQVVGTETVAMVVSLTCGVPTISISNLGKKVAPLPFEGIIRVRSAKQAGRLIN